MEIHEILNYTKIQIFHILDVLNKFLHTLYKNIEKHAVIIFSNKKLSEYINAS